MLSSFLLLEAVSENQREAVMGKWLPMAGELRAKYKRGRLAPGQGGPGREVALTTK